MSIIQFLRILWARRLIIVAATISCFLGALVVIQLVPPRYEANSRILLNLLRPDPVTGQVIANAAARGYIATQRSLIRDYSVAGQVVDELGWLSDPNLIAQYQSRPATDTRDFRRWVAQRIIDGTSVKVVEGSNILEITFRGPSPRDAQIIADALRKAYIDASLAFRREDAARTAEWYDEQSDKAREALTKAEAEKTAFEKETGIVLQADNTDVDSARLAALAGQSAIPPIVTVAPPSSAASMQLAQLDTMIAQASQTLGPNHPELQQMRSQRASVAALAAQEQAAARAQAGAAAASAGAMDRAMAAQRARVIAQRDKVERLSQLQAEVDILRDQFNKTTARAAALRQEAAIAETGLTPLGAAVMPQSPVFPNKPLIIFGSVGLGGAMGLLVALLVELFGRRVRGVEDLQGLGAPVLTVIAPPPSRRSFFRLPGPSRLRLAPPDASRSAA
jgi:polysaccharide biosynthesis transport protein